MPPLPPTPSSEFPQKKHRATKFNIRHVGTPYGVGSNAFGSQRLPRALRVARSTVFYKRGGNLFLLRGLFTNSYSITSKLNMSLGIFSSNGPLAVTITATTEASRMKLDSVRPQVQQRHQKNQP